MLKPDEEKRFLRDIWLAPALVIIVFGIVILIWTTYQNIITGQNELDNIRQKLMSERKNNARLDVKSIISNINFERENAEKKLKKSIKEKVDIAYDIIENIYAKNREKKKTVIINLIKNALRNIRFYDGRGYFFIYDLNGTNILLPIAKKFEGRDFSNYQDSKGNFVVRDMSKLSAQNGSAFYTWYWKKPNRNRKDFKKIGFAKSFMPLNLFVGTGEYLDDYIKDLQNTTLKKIKNTEITDGRYIFVYNYNGICLNRIKKPSIGGNFLNLKDKNAKSVIKEIIKIAKSGGGFLTYGIGKNLKTKKPSKKILYIDSVDSWGWALGTKIAFDDLESNLASREAQIYNNLYKTIAYFVLFGILLIFSIVLLQRHFSKKGAIKFLAYKEEKESIQQASKSKSEFLANMSHEIRTPLNAIMGFIELLAEEETDKEKLNYLNTISTSSKTLLGVIDDILDFSKIESGKLDIYKENFNASKEFSIITHLFDAKCSQKDITLTLNIDKDIPKFLNSDPLRIKQVILNLISNSVKFTPKGKNIEVSISYKDGFLNVRVEDEGIGIAKDKLSHIFEAFSQEDSSTTRKYGGTGLGLSISSALVKLLGGELKVKSIQGKGSKFYFSLPAEAKKNTVDKNENSDITENSFKGKKILLVEDNASNQMFMKIVFRKLNLKFDIANDGVEAVKMFKAHNYDAILMDENMPNLNGIEATKLILEDEKRYKLEHTPIIALTANAIKGDRERFLKAGMDEYLTKPIKQNILADMIGRFI
jgi:signal transduction histidine kinase/CheY-like chemotaxis protein